MTIYHEDIPEYVIPERRLGRFVAHDPLSWRYPAPMAENIETVHHVFPTNAMPFKQGNLGSCTGNAMIGMLMTGIFYEHTLQKTGGKLLDQDDAIRIYSKGTRKDPYRGFYPPTDTGSNGLAVCKVAREEGFIDGYAHCFSMEHLLRTLVLQPTITGSLWFSGMDVPDSSGVVHPSGGLRGGHEYLQVGLVINEPENPMSPNNLIECLQSWGPWGKDKSGLFYIPVPEFDQKLRKNGGDVKTGILL